MAPKAMVTSFVTLALCLIGVMILGRLQESGFAKGLVSQYDREFDPIGFEMQKEGLTEG